MTATKGGDGTTVAFGFYNENNLLDADAAKFEGKVVVLEYSAKLNRNAVADSTDKSALDHITVNSKTLNGGATTIRGLYGGGYTFTEAKAPEGYIGLLLPSFKVSATLDEGSNAAKMAVTDLGASRLVSFDAKADANAGRVTVANAKSLKDLPKTGAAGITLMSSVAAVLMACGAALILSRKHRA